MKRTKNQIRFLLLSALLSLTSCKPSSTATPGALVGDTYEFDNGFSLTLDSIHYERKDETCVLYFQMKFQSPETTKLVKDHIFASIRGISSKNIFYYPDYETETEYNGYDIFEKDISDSVEYTFLIDVPTDPCFSDETLASIEEGKVGFYILFEVEAQCYWLLTVDFVKEPRRSSPAMTY